MTRSYRDPSAPEMVIRTEDPWIKDETYTEVVQKMVIACTDVVLTMSDEEAIYLAKRVSYPMASVWLLGGRIFFNDDSLEDSIVRCLLQETGVKFDTTRFECVSVPHLYSFAKVAQGDFGGKSICTNFRLEISENELEKMRQGLDPHEYDREFGIQRFTRGRLVAEALHPALIDLYNDIFQTK